MPGQGGACCAVVDLKSFRKGIFDVLVACRALDEGLDVPEAELAIIAAGTSSNRQRIQRVGRVLRTIGGKGTGQVFSLYATEVEQRRMADESARLGTHVKVTWMEANHD